MSGCVDAGWIDVTARLEIRNKVTDELHIRIVLDGIHLPRREFSHSLRIDHDESFPVGNRYKTGVAREPVGGSAIAVEPENQSDGSIRRGNRRDMDPVFPDHSAGFDLHKTVARRAGPPATKGAGLYSRVIVEPSGE